MESKAEKIARLKRLIEESDREIAERNKRLAEIESNLADVKKKLELAEKELLKYKSGRLYTRKELKEMELAKLEKQKLEFEREKANIKIITQKKFEEAQKLRFEAQEEISQEQKSVLEKKALEIEKKATEHEIYIMNCILSEKQESYENMLVDKICSEVSSDKNNKKIYSSNFYDDCKKIKKEIRDLNLKISNSSLRLDNYL